MIETFVAAPVASIIFVITIALSLLAFSNEHIYHKFMLHPYTAYRGQNAYTVITSGFIHRDWMHLILNMWAFYCFSFFLEGVLGHWQFGFLYMLTLILSDLPTIYKHRDDYGYHSLGASGAISGVLFSAILFSPFSTLSLMFLPIPIPAWLFGILYLVYCWYASRQSRDSINHDAHFFGALSGIVITMFLNHHILADFLHQFGVG